MTPTLAAAVARLKEAELRSRRCSLPEGTPHGPARLCGACASGLTFEAREVVRLAAEPGPDAGLRIALETILRKTETYQLQDRGRDGLVDIARVAHAALGANG